MFYRKEEMTRIYILGGPGSGKTTLAKRLSDRLNVPCYELDLINIVVYLSCIIL